MTVMFIDGKTAVLEIIIDNEVKKGICQQPYLRIDCKNCCAYVK